MNYREASQRGYNATRADVAGRIREIYYLPLIVMRDADSWDLAEFTGEWIGRKIDDIRKGIRISKGEVSRRYFNRVVDFFIQFGTRN